MVPRSIRLLRQRGVAVITALLLTTLAITIVASLFWQQQVQVRSIENQRLQLQKQWILRGALDWARLILREDAKYSTIDTLDEPWSVPLSETRLDQYAENGRTENEASDAALSGSIIDAQSRYNLNNLSLNGTVDPIEVAVFGRLLGSVQLNPALALATANLLASTQVKPDAAAISTDNPRPMGYEHINDLLAVPGFSSETIDKLKDLVIFLPGGVATKVNVNTAPVEVLAARIDTLSLSGAAALVATRKTAGFRDLGDLTQRLQGKSLGDAGNKISFATNYFLVNGKVRMSRAGLEVQALIERRGAVTKLIWVQEN